jgi:hypothetical protein
MHRAGPLRDLTPHWRGRGGDAAWAADGLNIGGWVLLEPVAAPLGAEVVCRAVVLEGQRGLAVDVHPTDGVGRARSGGHVVVWGELVFVLHVRCS